MPGVCRILAEADPKIFKLREKRLLGICAVLKKLGFERTVVYGARSSLTDKAWDDETKASNLETQLGINNGWRALFNAYILKELDDKRNQTALIVATESWHASCFRGLAENCYEGVPLVELGIDYSKSFAKRRIFSSRWCMAAAAADKKWTSDWIYAPPAIPLAKEDMFDLPVYTEESDPFKLDHLYAMARGIPTVAPDWGVWAETVEHGVNGFLYRTASGRARAEEAAARMPPETVRACIGEKYGLDASVQWHRGFLLNLVNG